jgi:hypothetical protein
MTPDDTAARGRRPHLARTAPAAAGQPTPEPTAEAAGPASDRSAVHAAWDALAVAHGRSRPAPAPRRTTATTGPAGANGTKPSGLAGRPAPLAALKRMVLNRPGAAPSAAPTGDGPDLTLRAQRRLVEDPVNRDPRDIVIGPLPPAVIGPGRPDPDGNHTAPSAQDADPRRWGAVIVAHALRSVAGHKSPAQLHRWLAADVYGTLVRKTETARRLRRGRPGPTGQLRICSITLCRPTPRAAELTLIIRQGQTVHAATLRLDWRQRWVVTAMDLAIGHTHTAPPAAR